MILLIGVGDTFPKHAGFLNVDIRPLPNIDVVADAAALPFKDNEHDGIHSRNLVEHFSRHEIDPLFKEWARVLRQGGTIDIETVDMGGVMDAWRTIPTENLLDAILGAQTYPENFHKMAFTPELLKEKLEKAGFVIEQIKKFTARDIPRMIVRGFKHDKSL